MIHAFLRRLGVLAVLFVPGLRASALTIVPTYDSSVTDNLSPADVTSMESAFAAAAQIFTANFSDPVQINITVQAVAGFGTLGSSSTNLLGTLTYDDTRSALSDDATTADDATAVANLPGTDPTFAPMLSSGGKTRLAPVQAGIAGVMPGAGPGSAPAPGDSSAHPGSGPILDASSPNFLVTRAQAKALGLIPSDSVTDGTFTFGAGFSYTYDPLNRAVPGEIDFIGVAAHELSEIMGRIPLLGANLTGVPNYLPFDLFRYSAPGALALTNGNNLYFSIDGGVTDLKGFNFPNGNGSDPQDWASGANDSFNAFSDFGVENDVTPVDLQAMDVIGYDRVAAPEPGSAAWLAVAGGLVAVLRRKR